MGIVGLDTSDLVKAEVMLVQQLQDSRIGLPKSTTSSHQKVEATEM